MTLVVGHATEDLGFLVGDTRLSVEFELKGHRGPVSGEFHGLKIYILSPNVAIAFSAQDTKLPLELIARVRNDPEFSSVDTAKLTYSAYQRAIEQGRSTETLDCEFLVLQLTREGKRLSHVTVNGVRRCERAYIGEQSEYVKMCRLRRAPQAPEVQHVQQTDGTFLVVPLVRTASEIEFEEISDAMMRLTNQRNSETVGAICGLVTRVVDARYSGTLEYLQEATVGISPEEGATGFACLASNSDVRGVGIYYRVGGVGFLFPVGDVGGCRKVSANTLSEFRDMARKQFGMHLDGPTW